MSNTQQHKNSNTLSGWDEAIAKVKEDLEAAKERASRLKAAQWALERCKEDGIPWPGSIQAMMNKFDAGLAERKKPRRSARVAA